MNVTSHPFADILTTAETLLNGDCTVTRYGEHITDETGYVIGGACQGWSVLDDGNNDFDGLASTVASWIQAQPSNVSHFGSWRKNGRIYFDGVDIVENYLDAILLGFERQEQCMWDIAQKECIDLAETKLRRFKAR